MLITKFRSTRFMPLGTLVVIDQVVLYLITTMQNSRQKTRTTTKDQVIAQEYIMEAGGTNLAMLLRPT